MSLFGKGLDAELVKNREAALLNDVLGAWKSAPAFGNVPTRRGGWCCACWRELAGDESVVCSTCGMYEAFAWCINHVVDVYVGERADHVDGLWGSQTQLLRLFGGWAFDNAYCKTGRASVVFGADAERFRHAAYETWHGGDYIKWHLVKKHGPTLVEMQSSLQEIMKQWESSGHEECKAKTARREAANVAMAERFGKALSAMLSTTRRDPVGDRVDKIMWLADGRVVSF